MEPEKNINRPAPRLSQKIDALQEFIHKLGNRVRPLNELEAEIVELLANGVADDLVIGKIDLTKEEIKALRLSARKKLAVHNETDLIKYGFVLGLIRIWYDSLVLVEDKNKLDDDFKNGEGK